MFLGNSSVGIGFRVICVETKEILRPLSTTNFITLIYTGQKRQLISSVTPKSRGGSRCDRGLSDHSPPVDSTGSTIGSRQTLVIALRYSPVDVFTVTTRTIPSFPG